MALNKQLEETADRLKMALVRIDETRSKPVSQEQMQEWLVIRRQRRRDAATEA